MFHVKHEGWTDEAAALGVELPDDAGSRLDHFERLLLGRAVVEGMVASGDAPRIRTRHLLDCLRAAPLVAGTTAYDLGSGAGLPGVVIAIARPDVHVTLVEVRRHRVDFLLEAVGALGLGNAEVYPRRAETIEARVDTCLSRAFAGAPAAWAVSDRLLLPGGRLLYWAGRSARLQDQLPAEVSIEPVATSGLDEAGPVAILRRRDGV
jgi:16S rRNA (guanine527-N7)-methyltransferase